MLKIFVKGEEIPARGKPIIERIGLMISWGNSSLNMARGK
jgi:hypothetical protein